MGTRYKLLVLERGKPDEAAVREATRSYLPGLFRERVADVLLGDAQLPATIALSDKEVDIRRAKRVLEELNYSVCVVEDAVLFATLRQSAGSWRKAVGLVPEFFKTVRDVLLRRRTHRTSRAADEDGWLARWIPPRVRAFTAVAVPVLLLGAIAGVWWLFTTQVEGTGGGGDLQLPDWAGGSAPSLEPGMIWAGCAFAFGSVLGWTLVPFLVERKAGKKRGFLLTLGLLGGVLAVVLLAAVAPWRWMTGGDDTGGGGAFGGGGGGEYQPPDGDQTLDVDTPEGGPPAAPSDEGEFASFVRGLQGPESSCDPELSPFVGLLCELRAMGPPPEGFSTDQPDALADLLTESFEAMGDDDSADGDDDSAEDALADGDGTGEQGGGDPPDPDADPDADPAEEADEESESTPKGSPTPRPNQGGAGGGGGSGGGGSSQAQIGEEDDPDASPTRNLFKGDTAQQDSSIPEGYTKEGLKKDDEATGTLSEASTPSQTRDQAQAALALLCGLGFGGGLNGVRTWRKKR